MTDPIQALDPLRLPLRGSHLIEASAGTGKTYTIAALYLRLVLGHDAGDPQQSSAGARMRLPKEILVVTFTDAATQELRDRIRARLAEAASFFRGDCATDDGFLRTLRDAYAAETWPQQARYLDLAAQQMDEAAVSTIHGWCHRMLSEHAFASGSLFNQVLNTEQSELYLQAAQDYWRRFIANKTSEELAAYTLMTKQFSSPETLVSRSRELMHVPLDSLADELTAIDAFLTKAQQLRDEFHRASLWREAYAQFQVSFVDSVFAKKQVNGNKLRVNWLNNWLQKFEQWLQQLESAPASASLLPDLPEAGWNRLQPEGLQEAAKVPLSEDALALPRLLQRLAEAHAALPDTQQQILEHGARWLRERFRELQQQRAEIGFDDMLTRLRDALRGPQGDTLAVQLREQFPIAMIDEFQDTDPVQYEIFNRIYRIAETPEDNGVFLIGDPKQAIYSFRNADIYTYLEARRATAGRHHTLAKNFRSTTAMVAASNALFAQAEATDQGAFCFKQGDDNPLPFVPVSANGLAHRFYREGSPAPALALATLTDDDGLPKNLEGYVAELFAEQITRLLNDPSTGFYDSETDQLQRLQPKDIAILVNNGREAQLLRDSLRARQVGSVYLSDRQSVFAGTTAEDLYILLSACAQPRDPGRLRAVLGCQLLGLELAQLEQISSNEADWEALVQNFFHYHELWERRGVLTTLQQLLHDYEIPAKLLARPNGERELTDYLHLAELLQRQSTLVEGTHGLLRFLAEHIEAAREGSEASNAELQVRLESDAELVQIVTIHKSKGLQYPLVFLPFACAARGDKVNFPCRYHDRDGQLKVAMEDSAEVKEQILAERFAEELRKLYVAVTRAQYATFVGVVPFKHQEKSALNYLFEAAERDLSTLAAVPFVDDGEVPAAAIAEVEDLAAWQGQSLYTPPQATEAALEVCRMPADFRYPQWWIASYSALRYGTSESIDTSEDANASNVVEARYEDRSTLEQLPQQHSIHAFPRGAKPGTYLHNLLEDAAAEGFAKLTHDHQALQQFVHERSELAPWQEHQQVLSDWLGKYLQTPFQLAVGTPPMRLCDLQHYQAEPEFWFPANAVATRELDDLVRGAIAPGHARPALLPNTLQGMLKGFIDLVFEWQGKYYVADYKSNYLGADAAAYSAEKMQDKILDSRYDLQFVIYTLALHKLLGERLSDYDYDTHVGGALYLFLRGNEADTAGAYFNRPPRALIEALAPLFSVKEVA
ncbi:exodeoxyribonuclease V subunit beta [Pseudidiomarina salilacus]|uniref:exodeoxyribonuclease V subunit beta n=1 Tax=Pseudidiomarina salilacus TaxID=3384452 RepID=UPI0039846356